MTLKGFKVAILSCDGFEEVELTKPLKALKKAGATVDIIAPKSSKIRSWHRHQWHKWLPVQAKLEKTKPDQYDALLLPGGVINPDRLRTYPAAINFVAYFLKKDKPIAAICHGPLTLIETKRLRQRKLTSYHSIKSDLINAGALWVDKEVVLDDNLITSRQPKDLPAFIKTMIKVFTQAKKTKLNKYKKARIRDIAAKPFIE